MTTETATIALSQRVEDTYSMDDERGWNLVRVLRRLEGAVAENKARVVAEVEFPSKTFAVDYMERYVISAHTLAELSIVVAWAITEGMDLDALMAEVRKDVMKSLGWGGVQTDARIRLASDLGFLR